MRQPSKLHRSRIHQLIMDNPGISVEEIHHRMAYVIGLSNVYNACVMLKVAGCINHIPSYGFTTGDHTKSEPLQVARKTFTQERAAYVYSICKQWDGPDICNHATPKEYETLKTLWTTLPGSYSLTDALQHLATHQGPKPTNGTTQNETKYITFKRRPALGRGPLIKFDVEVDGKPFGCIWVTKDALNGKDIWECGYVDGREGSTGHTTCADAVATMQTQV